MGGALRQPNTVLHKAARYNFIPLCFVLSVKRVSVLGTEMPVPQTTKELFSDSAKRSTLGHLFHFYPLLCEIASLSHRSPSYWVQNRSRRSLSVKSGKGEDNQAPDLQESVAVERDGRQLAMECLKQIGREMGLSA